MWNAKLYESSKPWTQLASSWKELKKKREGIKKEIKWDFPAWNFLKWSKKLKKGFFKKESMKKDRNIFLFILLQKFPFEHKNFSKRTLCSLSSSPPLSFLHYPLNLSILLRRGKDNKHDASSSGERRTQRSKEKGRATIQTPDRCSFWGRCKVGPRLCETQLESWAKEGESPLSPTKRGFQISSSFRVTLIVISA